jgi:hypothetical protein
VCDVLVDFSRVLATELGCLEVLSELVGGSRLAGDTLDGNASSRIGNGDEEIGRGLTVGGLVSGDNDVSG